MSALVGLNTGLVRLAGFNSVMSSLVPRAADVLAHHHPGLKLSVVMQSLVAAGMGVTTIPGLALRAHRHPAITATQLPIPPHQIYAATYGEPPDPPATAALVTALTQAAAAQ